MSHDTMHTVYTFSMTHEQRVMYMFGSPEPDVRRAHALCCAAQVLHEPEPQRRKHLSWLRYTHTYAAVTVPRSRTATARIRGQLQRQSSCVRFRVQHFEVSCCCRDSALLTKLSLFRLLRGTTRSRLLHPFQAFQGAFHLLRGGWLRALAAAPARARSVLQHGLERRPLHIGAERARAALAKLAVVDRLRRLTERSARLRNENRMGAKA